jgi:hypothetical protein
MSTKAPKKQSVKSYKSKALTVKTAGKMGVEPLSGNKGKSSTSVKRNSKTGAFIGASAKPRAKNVLTANEVAMLAWKDTYKKRNQRMD